eukprot:297766_1
MQNMLSGFQNHLKQISGEIRQMNIELQNEKQTERLLNKHLDELEIASEFIDIITNSSRTRSTGGKHACIVYNNYLYVFGGANVASNERIYIGNMGNINAYSWQYIDYNSGSNTYYHRAVVDNLYNQIYLIGGRDYCCSGGTASRGIQIFDIPSMTMTLINTGVAIINNGRSSPAVILIQNKIYTLVLTLVAIIIHMKF